MCPSYPNPKAKEDNIQKNQKQRLTVVVCCFNPPSPKKLTGMRGGGGGGVEGEFGALCTREAINQERATADTP